MSKIEVGKRYFIPMYSLTRKPFVGWVISDKDRWIECEIAEIDNMNNVKLQSIEKGCGSRIFSYVDFTNFIKKGYILEKIKKDQHVKHVSWSEKLAPKTMLMHDAYILV